ncbi:MAG: Gfo/Idh/MocA family oxidoreductase [Anaerolineae bacterium]
MAIGGAEIVAICEPSESNYELTVKKLETLGAPPPPNIPVFEDMLAKYAGELEAAFIVTPHAYHYTQAKMCMEAGIDVLLEKPGWS